MKKKFTLLLALFPFIMFSCQKEELLVSENNPETRASAELKIIGLQVMSQGWRTTYQIINVPSNSQVTWTATNASIISSASRSCIVEFNTLGSATVIARVYIGSTPETVTLPITVIPDHTAFKESLKIDGPTSVNPNQEVTYKLTHSGTNYVLQEARWSVNEFLVSTDPNFNHAFSTTGTYYIRCSGTFKKGNDIIEFEKKITVDVSVTNLDNAQLVLKNSIYPSSEIHLENVPPGVVTEWEITGNIFEIQRTTNTCLYLNVINYGLSFTTVTAKIKYNGQERILTTTVRPPIKLALTVDILSNFRGKIKIAKPILAIDIEPSFRDWVTIIIDDTIVEFRVDNVRWEELGGPREVRGTVYYRDGSNDMIILKFLQL